MNCVKVEVSVAQLCLTLCNSMDCSSPGSSVRGIFQARILGRVAIFFSRGSSNQESNLSLLHVLPWQMDSFTTEPFGKPLIINRMQKIVWIWNEFIFFCDIYQRHILIWKKTSFAIPITILTKLWNAWEWILKRKLN